MNHCMPTPRMPTDSNTRSKIVLFLVLYLMTTLIFFGCGKTQPEGKVLAEINEYTLSLAEFEKQLAAEIEMDSEFKLTREAKENYLNQLIQKELLVQEAMKLELDRRDRFVKAIERYWQSTLIRDLIDLKSEEISTRTIISEEEIEERYNKMKTLDKDLSSLDVLQDRIRADLKEEKKTKLLEEWIETLKKSAKLKVNENLL